MHLCESLFTVGSSTCSPLHSVYLSDSSNPLKQSYASHSSCVDDLDNHACAALFCPLPDGIALVLLPSNFFLYSPYFREAICIEPGKLHPLHLLRPLESFSSYPIARRMGDWAKKSISDSQLVLLVEWTTHATAESRALLLLSLQEMSDCNLSLIMHVLVPIPNTIEQNLRPVR